MSQSGTQFSSSSFSSASFPAASSLPLGATAARTQGLRRAVGFLDTAFYLPDSPRAFFIYLLGLVIIFAGAFMHVLVAAQITEAQFRVSQLRQEYRAIEQQNSELIFEIARETNLARLQARAREAGYVPAQQREYVVNTAASNSVAATSPAAPRMTQPATAQSGVPQSPTQLANWQTFWRGLLPQPAPSAATHAGSPATADWQTWWQSTLERGAEFVERVAR